MYNTVCICGQKIITHMLLFIYPLAGRLIPSLPLPPPSIRLANFSQTSSLLFSSQAAMYLVHTYVDTVYLPGFLERNFGQLWVYFIPTKLRETVPSREPEKVTYILNQPPCPGPSFPNFSGRYLRPSLRSAVNADVKIRGVCERNAQAPPGIVCM